MKISCQNCSSKYTVSDEKVQGKTVKLKCKKCGATILVNAGGATTVAGGGGVADHVSSSADAASTDGTSYLVNVAEGDQRTMSIADLVAAYQTQVVTADTYVWADGMGDWQPLGQVDAIVAALNGPTPMAPAVAPSAPPGPMPMAAASSAEAAASAASLAASSRPAAATRRDSGKRADVFGSEKQDDIATSAPLFSASARAAASNAAAAAKPQQREENSVLFSLSALTSKSGTATPAPAPSRKDSREDSGLIDLRALAASANPAPSAASAVSAVSSMGGGDDGGLFPLGVPSGHGPAAPPVATPVVQAPPASKAPMFIGIGALVAALAIVGVFLAMKGGDDKPITDASTNTTSTPAAQPTPTPTAAPVATPEPTATATATASATAVASAPKGGPLKGGPVKGGSSTGGASTGGTGTKPATTAASPKSKCNCAPTDLMCNMKCSAGGK